MKNAMAAIQGKPAMLRAERIIESPSRIIVSLRQRNYVWLKRIALVSKVMALIYADEAAILTDSSPGNVRF